MINSCELQLAKLSLRLRAWQDGRLRLRMILPVAQRLQALRTLGLLLCLWHECSRRCCRHVRLLNFI